MRIDDEALDGVLTEREFTEVERILGGESVVGYAVFDGQGGSLKRVGISDNSVAVFSNLMDISERIGGELGETAPRPAMMFSGHATEMLALPLNDANLLVLKDKGANRGLRDVN